MALAPVREAASWALRFGAAHIVIILVWLGGGAGLQLRMGLRFAPAQQGRRASINSKVDRCSARMALVSFWAV